LDLAGATGELRRVFIWRSFVTAKSAPKDLDILLIMDEGFEVDRIAAQAQAVFDSVRAKLLFEADVFWAGLPLGTNCLNFGWKRIRFPEDFQKRGIVELELA
jgi:hypothetical protein